MAFSRGPRVVTDGLVLALDVASDRCYSPSTVALTDLSGNGNSMSVYGSPTYTATAPSYFTFTSAQTTKYIMRNPFSHPINDMSVEMWIRFGSTSLTGGLLSYEVAGAGNNNLLFFSSGALNFYGPSGYINTSWSIPTTTNWYQVVRTRHTVSGTETLYINGQSETENTLAAGTAFTSGGSLVIGQEQDSQGGSFDPAQCFIGDFSSIKMYNRVLTAEEVAQNYNALSSRYV